MTLQPAPGTGRTRLVDHVQHRLGILRGLSRFFARQTRADGSLVCPRHRVEHTGKNVYAALIDLQSWRYSREDEHLEQVRSRVLRTVDMLGLDPGSGVPVFLPGRVDPRNASTNSIDGGACTDVLATVLEELPELFDEREQQRIAEALERHVEAYLRHSARDKPIPAQRLWAGTGVARAARLLGRTDWRADALAGCERALDELAPDGVAPYIPLGSENCTHPGLADTSSFYHSRTPGFVLYIHDVLGEPLGERAKERLGAALDALLALRAGDGHKVLHDEAKAWYWESAYEVASHPFDAYALHTGARLLGRPLYSNEAGRAVEEWIAHINPLDGGVDSHHGRGVNFQCRVFWSAHGAWLGRVIEDVPLRPAPRDPVDVDLSTSGVLHVERPRYTAVLRGAMQPSGNLFGCDAGGGTLQSLVARPDPRLPGGVEQVKAERFRRHREGSFRLRPRGGPGRMRRLADLLTAEKGDLRFRLYVASVEWKARRWLHALAYPVRHVVLRSLAEASPWLAAHRDVATTHAYDGQQVVFRGGLAGRTGARLPGAVTERRYRFEADGVHLRDELRLEAGVRGPVRYRLPAALQDVEIRAEGATPRRRGRSLLLRAGGAPVVFVVSGRWAC